MLLLVEQLKFEKMMPIAGNLKQQIAIYVPSTCANVYNLGTYFIINILRCGPDYVCDPMNSFLSFEATIADTVGALTLDHCANLFIQKS